MAGVLQSVTTECFKSLNIEPDNAAKDLNFSHNVRAVYFQVIVCDYNYVVPPMHYLM